MPYEMVHLKIAHRIYDGFKSHINDLPQFYLGSVAPDAVHNRAGYVSDFKKASHLYFGEGKWGNITDNDGWLNNATEVLIRNVKTENGDFALGYYTHILSDMYNNIMVWTPFKAKHGFSEEQGYSNSYHREIDKINTEFTLTDGNRIGYWRNLEESKGIDFEDYVYADELEIQKDYILRIWFNGRNRQDLTTNKIVTLESTYEFINGAADFITGHLRRILN